MLVQYGRELRRRSIQGATPFAFNVGVSLCALVVGVALETGRVSRALGAFVALLGGLTLLEHATGADLGIGRVLFDPFRSGMVGRMAPNTAICVTLIGLALCARGRLSTALAAAPALMGLVAALGYTDPDAKAPGLDRPEREHGAAAPRFGICTTAVALILARERDYFSRQTGAGTITRRLGLVALLLPAAAGAGLVAGINQRPCSPRRRGHGS